MLKLGVVITSTRPGRVGLPVGNWFFERARAHGKFEVELIDLKEVALPHIDEPKHPRLKQYEHEHTKAWSRTVDSIDAFAFVTPEYNYSMPPALLNALDYVYSEWNYKAATIVGYGGVSGGLRSAQMSRLVLTSFRMMPIPEVVQIPFVANLVSEGVLQGNETLEKSASSVLDELHKWSVALKALRP